MKRIVLLTLLLLVTVSAPASGDFVDSATGYFVYSKTDLHIPGIIPVNITRHYQAGATGVGALGIGTYFEYDWWLGAYGATGAINNTDPTMFMLVKPGNYQYRFDLKQADGTFINDRDPDMSGAVVTRNSDSTRTLRMRDGWTYKFNSNGRLIEISDRNGNKLTITRSTAFYGEYITDITMPEGRKITFNQTYTSAGGYVFFRTDKITDHTGREVKYGYDTSNRLKTVTYPDGSVMGYQYDTSGRMSGIINERVNLELEIEYNSDNRVITQTYPDGGIYTYEYIVEGGFVTQTSMTAPNSAVTTSRFNNWKYITEKTTPDGLTTYQREPGTNRLLSVTDPLLRETKYTYYPNGLTKTITDNLQNITSYEYESVYGMPTKITNALGKDTTYTYTFDGSNRITKTEIRDPLLKLTTINYNLYGLPTSIIDPNNNTTSLYYENTGKPSELTKIVDSLNNASILHYDSLGRQDSTTDAKGKTTYSSYDTMSRIIEVMDALYGSTRYGYDGNGNLKSVTDAKNQVIKYEYDNRDRVKKMTDQLGKVETYTYDTSDRLSSLTDRKGQITTFNEYDLMNRLKKVTYHDGSYTDYTYDTVGKLMTISDSISGLISYTYSGTGCGSGCSSVADKIASETTPLGTISYTYDEVGRRKTMTVAGQNVVNYDYYDNGRPQAIRQVIDSIERKFNFEYDDGGRRSYLKYFKGIDTNPTMTTAYNYDNASRLLNMEHKNPVNQVLESIGYTYDGNGNRISISRPSVPLPLPQPVINSCGTTTYNFDARNRLVGISGFKPDCSVLTASFKYDVLGRRYEKTINGVTTQYVYDGLDIVQEIKNNTVYANYIRSLSIDEPLARIKADGTIRHYKLDALGSVIALTDDSGVVKTTYSYDPFGKVTISGEASDNPFQYTGRENDGTGLLYYRARYYSPELQRFISEDPIRDGKNYFVYTENNPIKYNDPSGLTIWVCVRKNGYGIGNHSYLYNDLNGTCCGKASVTECHEKGPFGKDHDACVPVSNSEGLEDKVMQCCKKTANTGTGFPYIGNDCFNSVNDCLRKSKLRNPHTGRRTGPPCGTCAGGGVW